MRVSPKSGPHLSERGLLAWSPVRTRRYVQQYLTSAEVDALAAVARKHSRYGCRALCSHHVPVGGKQERNVLQFDSILNCAFNQIPHSTGVVVCWFAVADPI
jgi:hypothetical protein